MKPPYYFFAIFVACLVSASTAFAECGHPKVKKNTTDSTSRTPPDVCETLRRLADKFGELKIVSGFRGKGDNARRGGAKGSMHLQGRAVDIVLQYTGHTGGTGYPMAPNHFARTKEVNSFLKQFPTRYNIYETGRIHLDNSTGLPDNYDSKFTKTYRSRDYSNYARAGTVADELNEQFASTPTPVPTIPDKPASKSRTPASDPLDSAIDASVPLTEDTTPAPPAYTPPPAPRPKKNRNQYTKRGSGRQYSQTRYFQKRYYDTETTNDIMMRALGQR